MSVGWLPFSSIQYCGFILEKRSVKRYRLFLFFQSAQNRLLIKNGKVVNEDGITDNDVYIEDGIIK